MTHPAQPKCWTVFAKVGFILGIITIIATFISYIDIIRANQISSSAFDENVKQAGTYIVKITIGGKVYNCLLIVKN